MPHPLWLVLTLPLQAVLAQGSLGLFEANTDVAPDNHPFYKEVTLRIMPVNGGTPKVIAYVYGGQGTINVPSWSPDSKRIAFVSNTGMD